MNDKKARGRDKAVVTFEAGPCPSQRDLSLNLYG
jgi:hypothetical protein